MRDIKQIAEIVENMAVDKYGNVKKMLEFNGLSKSVIDNMKREAPSVPNVITFCKIADSLGVTTDYLLKGETPPTAEYRPTDEGIAMYTQLDETDKAEIRGEMRVMLRAEKYKQGSVQVAARGGAYEIQREKMINIAKEAERYIENTGDERDSNLF